MPYFKKAAEFLQTKMLVILSVAKDLRLLVTMPQRWNNEATTKFLIHSILWQTTVSRLTGTQVKDSFMQAVKPSATLPILVLLAFTPRLFYPIQAQSTPPAPSQTTPLTSPSPPAPAPIAYDTQPLPKDPAAALQLASQANGLGAEGLKPWYLKAHYQTYDAQGNPATKGIFEFFWIAKDRYRVSFTSDQFTQSIYRTPLGTYRQGSSDPVPYAESLIWGELMHPLNVPEKVATPEWRSRKLGQVALNCLQIRVAKTPLLDAYCLDTQHALLRVTESNAYIVTYNKTAVFQRRFIAEAITVQDGEQKVLDIDLDDLRGMKPSDLQALAPPTDARKTGPLHDGPPDADTEEEDLTGIAKSGSTSGRVVYKAQPTYLAEAKQRRAQGTVRLLVTIGKDGLVHDPVVVHDPDPALSKSAVESVSKWRYTPYLLNGAPVDVRTLVRVTFILGG